MKNKTKVDSYGLVRFQVQLLEYKLKRKVQAYHSYEQVFYTSKVEIINACKFTALEQWRQTSDHHPKQSFFSIAKEIKSEIFLLKNICFHQNTIKEICQIRWSRLFKLALQSCNIESMQCFACLDAKQLRVLNLKGNNLVRIRGLVKLMTLWKIQDINIGNQILTCNALNALSEMSLQNISQFLTFRVSKRCKTQPSFDCNFLVKTNINYQNNSQLNYDSVHCLPKKLTMLYDQNSHQTWLQQLDQEIRYQSLLEVVHCPCQLCFPPPITEYHSWKERDRQRKEQIKLNLTQIMPDEELLDDARYHSKGFLYK